jgi:hypothetical protein
VESKKKKKTEIFALNRIQFAKLEQFQHVTGKVPKYKTSGSLTEHILSRNSHITVILFFIKELYVQMFFNTCL